MTEYGKRKCELLEKKGFKANDLVYWVFGENEASRTYYYVGKKVGSEVKSLTISIEDDLELMNKYYARMNELFNDYRDLLKENHEEGKIRYCDADTTCYMGDIAVYANKIDVLNLRMHDIEEECVWDEISDIFVGDCSVDEWCLKDDPELFGEEN